MSCELDILMEEIERQLLEFKSRVTARLARLEEASQKKLSEGWAALLAGDTAARTRLCEEAEALMRERSDLQSKWREAILTMAREMEQAGVVRFDPGFITMARARLLAVPTIAVTMPPSSLSAQ